MKSTILSFTGSGGLCAAPLKCINMFKMETVMVKTLGYMAMYIRVVEHMQMAWLYMSIDGTEQHAKEST